MALTAKQLEQQRDSLRRERERDARKADRERLRTLRAHLRASKTHSRQRMREVRELCRRGRRRARELAKMIRAQKRAEAAAEIDAVQRRSRAKCETRKDRARSQSADSLRRAAAALEAERQHQATMKIYEQPAQLGPKAQRRRRIEAIQESDSQVLQNIPPELVPVWRVVRGKIKSSPRRSRTEAFLEWAQEHAGDVLTIIDRQYQADVEAMAREEAKLRREVELPSHYRRMTDAELARRHARRSTAAAAAAVPF